MGARIGWLFDPASSAIVGGVGLIVTVLGFALTVIALVIAIEQILKTKNAVEESEKATTALRNRLAAAGTANYVTSAQAMIKSAKRELELKNWREAIEELEQLRSILLILHKRDKHLSATARLNLEPLISNLADHVQYFQKPPRGGITDGRILAIRSRLNELNGQLMELADSMMEQTS